MFTVKGKEIIAMLFNQKKKDWNKFLSSYRFSLW